MHHAIEYLILNFDTLRNQSKDVQRHFGAISADLEKHILKSLEEMKLSLPLGEYYEKTKEDESLEEADRFIASVLRQVLHSNHMYRREDGKRFAKDFNNAIFELFDVRY